MAKSWTVCNLLQFIFPGKNRIRKIRKKSGYQIPIIFGEILRMDTTNYCFMAKCGFFLVIFTNFDFFDMTILVFMLMNSEKFN